MKKVIVNYPGDNLITINLEDAPSHEQILAKVFASCNHGSGQECEEFKNAKTRSLSVNDLVKIDDQWYQCSSFGWKEVTEEFVDEIEKLVVDHPNLSLYGEWSALYDIMWSKRTK
jgi:hypothetical protein